jgi:hypothetical protein
MKFCEQNPENKIMSLPQARQQIIADLAMREAQHQAAIAGALSTGSLGQPGSPLNLLADGDSWFDYPLDANGRWGSGYDIIAQLNSLPSKPFILNRAHYGDATTTELGYTRVKKMTDAIRNPANGPFDAILFSGGGDDVVGDQFCIWLNDAASVQNDPTKALNDARFNAVLGLIKASYSDLVGFRNDELGAEIPIYVHGYDFAIPSGKGVYCFGPWLKPSLDYCGWTDLNQATQIVRNALTRFGELIQQLAKDATDNIIYVPTQGTLAATDWANELHPTPDGFRKIAAKFQTALDRKFPGRI